MAINIKAMNSKSNISNYNCGGFALRTHDWYCPDAWMRCRNNSFDTEQEVYNLFEDCVNDMLKDFPRLTRISHPEDYTGNETLVGFRFAILDSDDFADEDAMEEANDEYDRNEGDIYYAADDFHFVTRVEGTWYHKPGSNFIEVYEGDPTDECQEWEHYPCTYNSEIAWFVYK